MGASASWTRRKWSALGATALAPRRVNTFCNPPAPQGQLSEVACPFCRLFKWPSARPPRPYREKEAAGQQAAQTKQDRFPIRRGKNEYPAHQGHNAWKRIEPDAVRPGHLRLPFAEQHHGENLADELHQNARRDERVDDHAQRKKAE